MIWPRIGFGSVVQKLPAEMPGWEKYALVDDRYSSEVISHLVENFDQGSYTFSIDYIRPHLTSKPSNLGLVIIMTSKVSDGFGRIVNSRSWFLSRKTSKFYLSRSVETTYNKNLHNILRWCVANLHVSSWQVSINHIVHRDPNGCCETRNTYLKIDFAHAHDMQLFDLLHSSQKAF